MINLSYKNYDINQRESDGYVNATQMCQANGKQVSHCFATKDYKRYAEGLSASLGIPIDELVTSKPGQPISGGGTWVHPKLAIKLGRWISVPFELWCDDHIQILMLTGKTELTKQDSTAIASPTTSQLAIPEELLNELATIKEDNRKILILLENQSLGVAVKRIEGLDRTLGQIALDLTEQKQFTKGFSLAVQYLTELAKKTFEKFLDIEEKFESQADPRTLIAEDILGEVHEKLKGIDSERAQKFKKLREQNEINRFLRDNP